MLKAYSRTPESVTWPQGGLVGGKWVKADQRLNGKKEGMNSKNLGLASFKNLISHI